MWKRTRTGALGSALMAAALATVPAWSRGDDAPPASNDATPKSATNAARPNDASRRVPDYFGQIGLTSQQREQIYAIRARHLETIVALEKQIAEERAKMLAECEQQLTETQKQLLANLRDAAAKAREARKVAQSAGEAAKAKP